MRLRKSKTLCFILLFLCISFPRTLYRSKIYIINDNNANNLKNLEIPQADILIDSYTVPSVSESISSSQLIKVGLLDDLNYITGDHAWKGALLAAREVNEEGGISINGNNYYVGLVRENTNEAFGTVIDGIDAAMRVVEHHPHFMIGGFNSDFLNQYLDIVMNEKIPFLGTGAGGISLCEKVLDNYAKYKYFFRISPLNLTSLWRELMSYTIYLCYYLNATDGGIINKTGILRDSTKFFGEYASVLQSFLPVFGISILEDKVLPYDATATDFIDFWNQIDSMGVQVVLLMSAGYPEFGKLMAQTYQQEQPQCLIVSFSPFGQFKSDWDYTEGALQYEIVLQDIYNISKTILTIPFFTHYVNEYGIEPYVSGVGSYDAVKLLVQTVQETQTFDPDVTVSALENINSTNPFIGAGGLTAFSPKYHDLIYGWPFGHSLFCQWKHIDGTKVVVTHNNTITPKNHGYPDNFSTGSLRLPYWGIDGLLTRPPQRPGNFYLNCTADNPDYDGKFNLTWTNSAGADNYTVYMSDKPMTYISKNFETFETDQTASSPTYFPLKQGEYYFRVVAYNETGERMSSNEVHVSIPGPGPFSLDHNAGTPDTDGKFDLMWTPSERAENYSVFRYHRKITSINESLTLISDQTTTTSFTVTGLPNGKYYFAVAAYNEMGYTLSNCKEIIVQIPPDLTILFIVSFSSVAGIATLLLVNRYFQHKTGKKSKRERQEPIIVEDMTRETFEHKKIGEKNK